MIGGSTEEKSTVLCNLNQEEELKLSGPRYVFWIWEAMSDVTVDLDCHLIPGGKGRISEEVANILVRELCVGGSFMLREEEDTETGGDDFRADERLYLLDVSDPADSWAYVTLHSPGGIWRESLRYALDGSKPLRIGGESLEAREVAHDLEQAEVASGHIPDDDFRASALALAQDFNTLYRSSRSWTSEDWQRSKSLFDALEDRLFELIDGDFEDPEGACSRLEEVLDHRHLVPNTEETWVFERAFGTTDDGWAESWQALAVEKQVAVATAIVEEEVSWLSLLSAALLMRHPGTADEAKAVIGVSRLPRELEKHQQPW